LAGKRILMADDAEDNRMLVGFFITKLGADLVEVANGQEACDQTITAAMEDRPFDAILLDMQMPVLDGYAAARALRRSGYAGPIIALTADAMSGDQQKCLDAGCDGYLPKPIDRRALAALLEQRVGQRTEVRDQKSDVRNQSHLSI
jgi:CheY-like chemotaxis protein